MFAPAGASKIDLTEIELCVFQNAIPSLVEVYAKQILSLLSDIEDSHETLAESNDFSKQLAVLASK